MASLNVLLHFLPQGKDQKPTKFLDYYKQKYNVNITDVKQPLLISRPRERMMRRGEDTSNEPVLLIPELCIMTGLTDQQRGDFRLMKDVAEYTRTAPPQVRFFGSFRVLLV
jgi:aubergine-like protein